MWLSVPGTVLGAGGPLVHVKDRGPCPHGTYYPVCRTCGAIWWCRKLRISGENPGLVKRAFFVGLEAARGNVEHCSAVITGHPQCVVI